MKGRGVKNSLLLLTLIGALAFPLVESKYVLGAHVLVVALAPAWLPTVTTSKFLRGLWLTGGAWSFAQLASNVFNGGDVAAAVGALGLLVPATVTLMVWMHDTQQIPPARIAVAFSVGWLLLQTLNQSEEFASRVADNPWKYGLALPVAALALSLAWRVRAPRPLVVLILLGFAGVSVYFDSRFYALTGAAVAVWMVFRGQATRSRVRRVSTRKLAVIGAMAVIGLYLLYPQIALSGYLGDRAQAEQRVYEASGTNFLIANRTESLQAAYIVAHEPVLGTGAKNSVDVGTAYGATSWLSEMGVLMTPEREAYLLGPERLGYASHSAALDSAIQAGVVALLFWIYCGWHIARHIVSGPTWEPALVGLLGLVGGATLWNMLFSPLDSTTYLALTLALFLTAEAKINAHGSVGSAGGGQVRAVSNAGMA